MNEQYPADVQQKAKDFIAALKASVMVRRYAEAYLDHLVDSEPQPPEFKVDKVNRRSASYAEVLNAS